MAPITWWVGTEVDSSLKTTYWISSSSSGNSTCKDMNMNAYADATWKENTKKHHKTYTSLKVHTKTNKTLRELNTLISQHNSPTKLGNLASITNLVFHLCLKQGFKLHVLQVIVSKNQPQFTEPVFSSLNSPSITPFLSPLSNAFYPTNSHDKRPH
jgi:hypothetical protein